jgi:type VI secretion system protein ImpH
MADPDGTSAHALELWDKLERGPHELDFFHLMRTLECIYREAARLGESSLPAEEPVRLAQRPSLAFAPAALGGFEPGKNGRAARLFSLFFGLFGPNGPLPTQWTYYAHQRALHSNDLTLTRFLDVFHHRLMTLFYRAWANAQPAVSFDRPESDRFGSYLGSLFGIGFQSLRNRDAMPDLVKLHFAGRLACQTCHPEGLESILNVFFRIPARVREFVGHWLHIRREYQTTMGLSRDSERLGVGALAGERVWDRQSKFRLAIGPMGLVKYRNFLPAGCSLPRLVACVRNYAGDEFEWDVNLILKKEEVPQTQLGVQGRLGWTTWLVAQPPPCNADDLCLDPSPWFQ